MTPDYALPHVVALGYPRMLFSIYRGDDDHILQPDRTIKRLPAYYASAHWVTSQDGGGTTPLPKRNTDDEARAMCDALAAKSGIRLTWYPKNSSRPRWRTQWFRVPECDGMITPVQRLSEILKPISLTACPETRIALLDI